MLRLDGLVVDYGKRLVLSGVSLSLRQGGVLALIGANAAGKTTTLRTVAGLKQPSAGSMRLDGQELRALSPARRVRSGLVLVPEGRLIFPGMSVHENLMMGAYTRPRAPGLSSDLERIYDLFPRLKERQKQFAGTMSGGEQQMVAIGRGLMAAPKLLLLDEPTLGLAPVMMDEIGRAIRALARDGLAVLLAEQNAGFALQYASHACILENGNVRLSGSASEVAAHPNVAATYLGY